MLNNMLNRNPILVLAFEYISKKDAAEKKFKHHFMVKFVFKTAKFRIEIVMRNADICLNLLN